MDELGKAGLVTMAPLNLSNDEVTEILKAIFASNAGQSDYRRITPTQGLAALREELLTQAPSLDEYAQAVRTALATACGIFMPSLGLAALDENSRALLNYALAVCLGNPTATDKRQVIWDVQARIRESGYFSTFSETDQEAAFHTDTQYFPNPEPTFLLYCMTPAQCGGGISIVCDARALRDEIEAKDKWIVDVLTQQPLPFRVPSAFVTHEDDSAVQATLAPVFAQTPLIRYRRDTLAEGLRYFPEYTHPDTLRALDAFEAYLHTCSHTAEFFMPRDSLLIVDNHQALHARTSFQDDRRHLLRIRLTTHEQAQAGTSANLVTRFKNRSAMGE